MNDDIKLATAIGDKYKGVDVIGKGVNETAENLQEMFDMDAQTRAAIKRMEEWVKDHPLDKEIIDKYKDIDDGGVLAGLPARE